MKIYMPIEVSSRELEARVLLAFFSAKANFDVVLGRKKELIDHALADEPGIFLSQWGLHRNFLPLYKKLKRKGHLLVCFDEEGLVTLSFDSYCKAKINEDCVEIVDKVLLWGGAQEKNLKAAFQSCHTKFKAVGNPRDDILHTKFRNLFALEPHQPQSKNSHGIVFVSSFGFANHAIGGENYFKDSIKNGVFFDKEVEAIFRDYLNFQKKNFSEFVNLVETVAKDNPHIVITYRCHPAENRLSLLERFRGFDNVRFSYGGSVIPVLRESELVVHNYCHAGIEAQILGKRTIAFRYFKDSKIENEQVYENSVSVSSVDEARSKIRQFISFGDGPGNKIRYEFSPEFLFSDSQKLSVERFVDIFGELRSDINTQRRAVIFSLEKYIGFVKRLLRKSNNSYVDQKSEGLDLESVKRILGEIMRIYPNVPQSVECKQLKPFVFALKSEYYQDNE